jgi:hypothetical protein
MFTMNKEVVGLPSVMILLKVLTKNICERLRFTISELSFEFPQIPRTVPYEIITVRLRLRVSTERREWPPSALISVERYHKYGIEFLNFGFLCEF